ncbi:MAG: hypothetical protein HYY06_25120 [Deltaproteobacteria bacterium]|nr:hypothetical protein [Deltaproteobacteria bacterium]
MRSIVPIAAIVVACVPLEVLADGGGLRVEPLQIEHAQALDRFHAELEALADGRRKEPVRIVVYGDSNLAADRLTGALRRLLQGRHGDAGHGFVAFGEPWPGYRHQDVRRGWSGSFEMYNPTTRRGRDHRWGYGGVAVESVGPGTVWVGTSRDGGVGGAVERFTILYLSRPRGGSVDVELDGQPAGSFSTAGERATTGSFRMQVVDGPHELRLRAHAGVRLFGAILERHRPGIVVDSIGIGALSTYNLLILDRAFFVEQLALRRPDLVVLTMGTNDQNPRRLVAQRGELVDRIREAAPDASILMCSPPDHARWHPREAAWRSEPRMASISRALRPIAAQNRAAFWDLFNAMGGPGSVSRWTAIGFVAGDRIHLRQPLADRMAAALVEALDHDRDRWRRERASSRELALR